MFIRIRKYTVRHGASEELTRRVDEGYLPLLRQMPGFKGYYLLDGGPDVLVSISVFDSAETALASGEKTAAGSGITPSNSSRVYQSSWSATP